MAARRLLGAGMRIPHFFTFALCLPIAAIGISASVAACSDPVPSTDAGSDASQDAASVDASQATDASQNGDASQTADASKADGGLTAAEKAICDAKASRAQCFDGSGGPAEPCSESTKCIYGRLMAPAAVSAYASCNGFPSCKGDDGCIAEAGEAVGGQASRDYVTACLAKVQECGPALLDDELCTTAAYAYTGIGASVTACLAKPCADQKACFTAAVAPIAACKQL